MGEGEREGERGGFHDTHHQSLSIKLVGPAGIVRLQCEEHRECGFLVHKIFSESQVKLCHRAIPLFPLLMCSFLPPTTALVSHILRGNFTIISQKCLMYGNKTGLHISLSPGQ